MVGKTLTLVFRVDGQPLSSKNLTTKSNHNLVNTHIESLEGRLRQVVQQHYHELDEQEISEKIENWQRSLLTLFPRKDFNGRQQLAITNTHVLGFIHERSSALKLKTLTLNSVKQLVEVRPRLIGLLRGREPITSADFITDTVVSKDKFGKRSALRVFETVQPVFRTETIHITTYSPQINADILAKLFEFGRIGASRKQGYGAFHGKVVAVMDG